MIDRLSTAASVSLHLALLVLLARITFAVNAPAAHQNGMEIEIFDSEYAMPDARPMLADLPARSFESLQRLPAEPTELQPLSNASSEPASVEPPPISFQEPVPIGGGALSQPTVTEVARATLGRTDEAPERVAESAVSQTADKVRSTPRLDAAALGRSGGIPSAAPASEARLNSATIGSAIGKAAPRGVAGLTFRQRIDLARRVREQVMPCWNPPPASEFGPATVRLSFRLDRLGRVVGQPAQTTVTGRSEANEAYVSLLTSSGRRAIFLCAPLELPPELYEAWAEVEVEFDPRDLQ